MTDNEIIKTLECCTTNGASCKGCPAFVKVDRSNCKKYFRGALDLINRLKADIEERTDQFDRMSKVASKLHSELVSLKVGIEKLKENAHTIDDDYSPNGELTYIEVEEIDNLLKEMGCENA